MAYFIMVFNYCLLSFARTFRIVEPYLNCPQINSCVIKYVCAIIQQTLQL